MPVYGTLSCDRCGGSWHFPSASLADERTARSWAREHERICAPVSMAIYRPTDYPNYAGD